MAGEVGYIFKAPEENLIHVHTWSHYIFFVCVFFPVGGQRGRQQV